MAVRLESVRLSLEDDFTTPAARVAAATALINRELHNLDGTSVRATKSIGPLGNEVEKVGTSTRKSGPDIDKYSGRLRTLADAALTLGPTLIPIGAASIPVLTAALAGLGAAAGGIGAAVLAFHGLGDGLKALDTYQLDKTPENLQALRIELEKLGPAGVHFVHFLDGLEPTLQELQNTARAGLFPGVEDGITDLLTRLPQVKRIVSELSEGMGELASDAGDALAGDRFDAFFHYIETDARPTLEAFAHSAGNVALGVANLIVAFAPLSRDFTHGLEDATDAFAKWSEGLDDNQSFQDFVTYVRESGPQVVSLLGSLAEALAGLIHAGAPLGRATVPALTAVARAFALIANSPIGPPLYTAVAALVAFNRVASLTNRASTSMSSSFKRLSGDTTTVQSRLSLLAGRGGVILAVGAAAGQLADNIDRIDPTNLERSLTALKFGDVTDEIDKVIDSLGFLESKWNNTPDFGEIVTAGGLFGDDTRDKMQDNVDQVDQMLAQMVEAGSQAEASGIFQKITDLASAKGIDPSATAKNFDAYALALKNAAAAADDGSGKVDEFGNAVDDTSDALDGGTSSAQRFSDALAGLNGWLDKRQAVRDYRAGIDDLSKSLKNGFQPKDAETLDAVGRNITQVASLIKDKGLRADFLAGARQSLEDLANKSGPKAKQQIDNLINALDQYGVTKPPKPQLGVDDKATPTLDDLGIKLRRTGETNAKPKVTVDPGNSISLLDQLARLLGSLHSRTITVTTNHVGGVTSSAGGHSAPDINQAGGGTVPGQRLPYGDKVLIHAAPGEEIITNRHGEADRFRRDRAAGMIPAYANGGLVANTYTSRSAPAGATARDVNGSAWFSLLHDVVDLTVGLKALKRELNEQQKQVDKSAKALDKETQKRDQLVDQMDALSGAIGSGLRSDIFATNDNPWASSVGGVAQANATLQGDITKAQQFQQLTAELQARGLHGAALQAVLEKAAENNDTALLQEFAGASASDLAAYQSLYDLRDQTLTQTGQGVAQAVFGQAYAEQTRVLERIDAKHDKEVAVLREIKQAINDADKNNTDGQKEQGAAFATGVNTAAFQGKGNRVYGPSGPR